MKDIFLCHTGADKAWVETLATRLEAETIKGRPLQVFFDRWDIDYGENILSKIEEALKSARFIGVVMSPAFTRADWPRLEWQTRVWQDPTGKAASILPILLHTHDPETGSALDIPLPLRMLKWLDFSDPKQFATEFNELLRRLRGEPPRRGGGGGAAFPRRGGGPLAFIPPDAPDRVSESLVGNLLQVRRHPARIWSDLTPARAPGDVWKVLKSKFRPPFVLDGGRLFSFYPPDLPANPFRGLLTGRDPKEERSVDWLADPVRSRWLMWLYNDAFREHAYRQRILTPRRMGQKQTSRERQQFYCPTLNGKPREFRWSTKARSRTLAKVAVRPDGTKFGVHQAARMRFIGLGSDVYLLVEPGWFFTDDGVVPVEGRLMGILSTRWGGRERNAGVLRNLLMWGLLLAGGKPTIDVDLGAETLVLDPVPAHARMTAGVDGDQMRLERVLGADGAGEFARTPGDTPYSDTGEGSPGTDADDLDHLIALEASGALAIVLEAESSVSDGEDRHPGAEVEDHIAGKPTTDEPTRVRQAAFAEKGADPDEQRAPIGIPQGPTATHARRRGRKGTGAAPDSSTKNDDGASTSATNLEFPF